MANILLPGVDYSCWRLSAAKLRPSLTATVCNWASLLLVPHATLAFLLPSSLLPFRTETVADVGLMWGARVTACWCQVSCSWKLSWPSLWWWPNGNMIEDCHGLVSLGGTSLLFQRLWLNFVDIFSRSSSHPQFICVNRLIECVLHRELSSQRRNQGKSLPSQNPRSCWPDFKQINWKGHSLLCGGGVIVCPLLL